MNILDQIHHCASAQNTFDNFFSSQKEIKIIRTRVNTNQTLAMAITGYFGSGVSHFLYAICNENKNNKRTAYITAPWLIFGIKQAEKKDKLEAFQNEILDHDLLVLDNLQFLYRKNKRYTEFVKQLIELCLASEKQIILGFNTNNGNIKRSQRFIIENIEQIELKELSTYDVFRLLKSLCSSEDHISDHLIYYLSGFNGSIRQHIHCLISLRFRYKKELAIAEHITPEEIERAFKISSYYPKQQLRKSFRQIKMEFTGISKIIRKKETSL